MKIGIKIQKARLKKALNIAGARYTPELNIELPINEIFNGLCRTPYFYNKVGKLYGELRRAYAYIGKDGSKKMIDKEYQKLDSALQIVFKKLQNIKPEKCVLIPLSKIKRNLQKAKSSIWKVREYLEKLDNKNTLNEKPDSSEKRFSSERNSLYQVINKIYALEKFFESEEASAANNPLLFLKGIAGSGKTHLFCDIAKHRLSKNLPTLIFLGEEFSSSSPFESMIKLLGLRGSKKKFLSTLNNIGKKQQTKFLILVDALNEEQSNVNWSELMVIKNYSHLCLGVSSRSGFEDQVLKPHLRNKFLALEHEGFSFREWDAVTKFFKEYNIKLPEVPLLLPEFQIPLFLKIFCEAHRNSSEIIKGHLGATDLFEDYVIKQGDQILKKLGLTTGRDKGKHLIWDGLIKEFAEWMGKNGKDRVLESKALELIGTKFPHKEKEVLALLQKYWVLTKIPHYNSKTYKQIGFAYRFPYQKFSDHLIARYLLTGLNKKNAKKLFSKSKKLRKRVEQTWNSGLLEALSTQIPERLAGKDLFIFLPKKLKENQAIQEAFLQSLIWRNLYSKNGKILNFSFKEELNYINKYLIKTKFMADKVLDTFITTATIPSHPFNAKLLHNNLIKKSLAERDAWWSIYLHENYGNEGAIDRLVNWAWNETNKKHISDESIRLAGVILCWFLTSSNRFLRDRATKALVCLFDERARVLVDLLHLFDKVNDPYVKQRVYAVAYGCALRSDKNKDIALLAEETYKLIFKNGHPPVDYLLRDYARGVIEVALYKKISIKIDIRKIRPPYKSKWPKSIPTESELEKKCYPDKHESKPDESKGMKSIWFSVMSWDFGTYVINPAVGHWTDIPLNAPSNPTKKEIEESFTLSLDKNQLGMLEELQKKFLSRPISILLATLDDDKNKNRLDEVEKFESEYNKLESDFLKTLKNNQLEVYKEYVSPSAPRPRDSSFDPMLARRFIMDKVGKLGWKYKLFGDFDNKINERMREAHKSERIGKKYQWIALHELIGRISDNFKFKAGYSDEIGTYEGPWEINDRDIDPSCLLKKTGINNEIDKCWWGLKKIDNWETNTADNKWVKQSELPSISSLISKKRGPKEWMVLDGFFKAMQPYPAQEETYEKPRREIWIKLKSYIVKRKDAEKIFKYLKSKNLWGSWLPESHDFWQVFLEEYPWHLSFKSERSSDPWVKNLDFREIKIPGPVLVPNDEYQWGNSSFDCSLEDSINIDLPSLWLYNQLGLRRGKIPGTFLDKNKKIVAFDPSINEEGPSALLIEKSMLKNLRSSGYDIIWNIIGERQLIGGDFERRRGRLEFSATYKFNKQYRLTGKLNSRFSI